MARSAYQKLKPLYIMNYLLQNSDEDHLVSMSQLIEHLAAHGIPSERKSVYDDIEALRVFGLDIVQGGSGKNAGYYIANRSFELPELKLLVDSVQSSKFITHKKTATLIKKIETLASIHEAQLLNRQVYVKNRIKTMNESIYYNIDAIQSGISQNKKIQFKYFEYTVQKTRHYRKDGAFYVVSPFAMTWDDENYYLVAYDAAAGIIKHYRVDKMQNTEILETDRKGEESFKNFDLAAFAKKTFGMYGGVDAEVTLECRNELAGVIIDRFGHDVWLIPQGKDHFKTRVLVSVSPQFFGWVTGIGSGMKITGPENVKAEYKAYLQDVLENY